LQQTIRFEFLPLVQHTRMHSEPWNSTAYLHNTCAALYCNVLMIFMWTCDRKITVFWDVTMCTLFRIYPSNYMTSHARKQ
jgi:hypothetical protein